MKRRITAYLETARERVRQAEIAAEKARAVAAAEKRASRFRLVAFSVGFALILASTFFYLRQQGRQTHGTSAAGGRTCRARRIGARRAAR